MQKNTVLVFALLHILFHPLSAQNPICLPGVYMADPSARVWNNKLYLYCSTDESPDYWCSYRHDLLASTDLKNWNIVPDIFASRGKGDEVHYNNNLLFAPDCAFDNDTFYLYYCQPSKKLNEGVAVSLNPEGPFRDVTPINIPVQNQIDPAVFIDNDGSAYYLWGQYNLKIARLKDNMREIDTTSIKTNVLTEKEHCFHEGAYMTKRKGTYYIIYADISRNAKPTCIGYATSSKPYGPYTYRGVIIDNAGCNPGNWNNHGSIAEFKGQWYVFYHRSTHGAKTMRKACIEPISFNKDGSIPEVEMTSQGVAPPFRKNDTIDAAQACLLKGNVRIVADKPNNEILTAIKNADEAIFKYVDLTGVNEVSLKIKTTSATSIQLYCGNSPESLLGTSEIKNTLDSWQIVQIKIRKMSGKRPLKISAYLNDDETCSIDWIKL